MPRSRHLRAFVGLAVAVALLTGVELALRARLGPPPAPVRVYSALATKEGPYFRQTEKGVRTTYVNRDVPGAFPPTLEGPRCAVLGGSSVHGGTPGLHPPMEFPALLEDMVDYPVLNLAQPGFDSFDMVEIVEELVAYDFTCLVLYGAHNDFGNAYFQARFGTVGGTVGAYGLALFEHSRLFVQLRRLLAPSGIARDTEGQLPGVEGVPLDPARARATVRYLVANHERMLWLAADAGIRTVVVGPVSRLLMRPHEDGCEGGECALATHDAALALRETDPPRAVALLRRARDLDRFPVRAPTMTGDALRQAVLDRGGIYVDTAAGLPQDPTLPMPDERLMVDDVHFSPWGHVEMAKLLARVFAKYRL